MNAKSETAGLNCEQQQALQDKEEQLREAHEDYLKSHPELRQMLNDFIASALLQQPDDIFDFAKDYFTTFKKESNASSEGTGLGSASVTLVI
ncbi:hypothetical protein FOL47_006843 [Perkinsus chesapeaki]|uniref:RIIa domain-containing protein n=1 Tax=Perkinsus chesapeaki TaxID=330153 RepID=A0A7J6LPE4_PERCH|nr:hypothetical protein FOL47_006843 [Perkinsus chesapeaki]